MANRAIPQDVILIWPGTHAGIPGDWTRETTLDDKFAKAWGAVNPNNTGGNESHTHVGDTHTHTKTDSHTHSMSVVAYNGGGGDDSGGTNTDPHSNVNHGHANSTISTTSGGNASDAITYPADSTTNNRPPYYDVIFVKAGANSTIATDMIGLWNTTTAPSGWRFCTDGLNGAPALGNKYPRGASTGGNGGGTGGSLTHTHALNHSHSTSHSHTGYTGTSDNHTQQSGGTGSNHLGSHQHAVTLNSATVSTDTYSATLTSSDTEPTYKKILAMQRQEAGETAPTGIIGFWLGATTSIPPGWTLCDGTGATPDMRDKFIKFANATGELGNTGGANTHSHAASNSHSHSESATHTHTASVASENASQSGNGGDWSPPSHSHSTNAVGYRSATLTWGAATMSAQTTTGDGNQPPFRTAALIMLTTTFDLDSANSVKAYIYYKDVSYTNSTTAYLREGVAHSYVTADIVRYDEQLASSAKSSIVTMDLTNSMESKSSIVTTNPKGISVKTFIQAFAFTKQYEYRVYDASSNAYVSTWSNEVVSEPHFKMVINSGPGEMMVKLARHFDEFGEDVDVKLFNRVECWCFDREAPNGLLIYEGYVSGYKPVMEELKEYVEITLLPYSSQLSYYILRNASNETVIDEVGVDPSQMFKDILGYYRADGGRVNYSDDTIDMTGTTVDYTFKTYVVKEALDKAIQLTPNDWYWRVDADNMLYLKQSNMATADHTFLIGRDINHMETWRRGEDLYNRIYFVGAETAGVALYRVYSNSASISSYGIHGYKQVDSRVTGTTTADIMANRTLAKKKDPEIRTSVTIVDSNGTPHNRGYDIESVKPGQTMRIRNIKQPKKTVTQWDIAEWDVDVWDQTLAYQAADIIQIQSVDYTPNAITIQASSRTPDISKRVEDINRNWEENAAKNTPTTPTVG